MKIMSFNGEFVKIRIQLKNIEWCNLNSTPLLKHTHTLVYIIYTSIVYTIL